MIAKNPISIPQSDAIKALAAFYSRIHRTENGCWEWTGQITGNGYGWIHWKADGTPDKKYAAHRFSYVLHHGEMSGFLEVDHLCRNRKCVNPSHLEAVTREENVRRGISPAAKRAAQTHCVRGHALSGENLIAGRRWRTCRACKKILNDKHNGIRRLERVNGTQL